MNEAIFFLHILTATLFLALATRLGKAALGIYIALSGVLANLFVVKQIKIFDMAATASDVFAVGGILGLNLLQELFGQEAVKRVIWASLSALVFFAAMSQIHLLYEPSAFDETHLAFEQILSSSFRITFASIAVYSFVQRIDVVLFSKLKQGIERFGLRVFFSLLLSQAIDTALFSFLGLYGIVQNLFEVMLVSYGVKCAVIVCSSPLASLLKRMSKKASHVSI